MGVRGGVGGGEGRTVGACRVWEGRFVKARRRAW